MRAITIPRQNSLGPAVQPTDVTVHLYPFQTLPLLESHVHPKFIIFEAGRRMEGLQNLISSLTPISQEATRSVERLVNGLRTQWPAIERIERIYHAWVQRLDLSYILADPTFNPPTLADPENDASKRNNNTLRTPPRERRIADTKYPSPQRQNLPYGTRTSCKRQRDRMPSDPRILSKRTLQSWDRAQGGKRWTRKSILSWSADCTADADDDIANM